MPGVGEGDEKQDELEGLNGVERYVICFVEKRLVILPRMAHQVRAVARSIFLNIQAQVLSVCIYHSPGYLK